MAANDLGTAVLLAGMARARVPRLLLAGSMVVYGEGRYDCPDHGTVRPGPRAESDLRAGRFEPRCPFCGADLAPGLVAEDAPADPRNVYATTKLAQEHLASSWARATGGRVISLRYHNVYGPGMPRDTPYAGVAALFRSSLARGEAPRVFEDGGQRRDFVHVRDVAAANAVALESLVPQAAHTDTAPGPGPEGFTAYNVGSGDPRTVGDMAAALAAACGARTRSSPASTASATSGTSPPTRPACAVSWTGAPRSPSPRAWPNWPRARPLPLRRDRDTAVADLDHPPG